MEGKDATLWFALYKESLMWSWETTGHSHVKWERAGTMLGAEGTRRGGTLQLLDLSSRLQSCRNIFFIPDSSCLDVWKTEPLPKKSTSNIVSPFGPLLPQVVQLPTKPATFSCATGKCKLFFFPSTQHTEGKPLYKLRVGSYTGRIYRCFTEVCRKSVLLTHQFLWAFSINYMFSGLDLLWMQRSFSGSQKCP